MNQFNALKRPRSRIAKSTMLVTLIALLLGHAALLNKTALAQQIQPPAPCHPNPNANQDMATVRNRDDVKSLPAPLKERLAILAGRPHSILPVQAFAEADKPSQLFQYYLLDTHGFEPNVFTSKIQGVNDAAQLTATGTDCGLETIGAVRLVLEPKPDLPIDPNNPRAFIDVFTDISGLFVINNESGWYEGWMIHDLTVPAIAKQRPDGHAQFGTITKADAEELREMGQGNNVPGHIFTMDGKAVHFPSETDHFPDKQTNVVPLQVSIGAYNSFQQSDSHSYWEFNYLGTNWVHPLYELPFTGGFPDKFGGKPDAFQDGEIGALQSIVPGSGPAGVKNSPVTMATIPISRATQISSTATSTDSANFANGVFPAAWPMRSFWMFTRGLLRLNRT